MIPSSSVTLIVSSEHLLIKVFGAGLVGKSPTCFSIKGPPPPGQPFILNLVIDTRKSLRTEEPGPTWQQKLFLKWLPLRMRQFNGKPKQTNKQTKHKYAMYSLYFPPMRIFNCELPKSLRQHSPRGCKEAHTTERMHGEDDQAAGRVQNQAWHPTETPNTC